jgi:ribulose-5-phosphate 4-epimerase/fuculose-1-phosphate aldolase
MLFFLLLIYIIFIYSYNIHSAGACIHTHSMHAMMVTQVYKDEFRISKQEMIKGIDGLGYLDELIIPIIDNTPNERDLKDSMEAAMKKYPKGILSMLCVCVCIYVYDACQFINFFNSDCCFG